MHMGRPGDKGGNDIKLKWFGKSTNLHRVWDSNMIDDYGMSYSELAKESPRLSKRARKEMMQGTPLDWMKEGHEITKKLYEDLPEDGGLGYEYAYKYTSVMRNQLQKGGLRLAKLLEALFG
ncbi:MAG: S1/P1 nuclease, partial [Flavobacteriaceae bacterium]|nr:S1/P1 nuclease [Flavobacteriaceae bacterium]